MATYKYRCPVGHEYEAVQSIHDEPYTTCGQYDFSGNFCDESVKRVPCTTAFSLLGSNWPGRDMKKGQS